MSFTRRRDTRSLKPPGFTLVEVVLAIALSTVLLALLTSAIGFYLLRVDSSRNAVEQAQLSRSLLRLIANDLRSAATLYEQNVSTVNELAAAQASFDVDELDASGGSNSDSDASTELRRAIGLYGFANELQVDVNRARPIDPAFEYGAGEVQAGNSVLRGVTTVRYFVSPEGLARQETSRDVDVYEADGGISPTLEASTRMIASEVVALQFAYSDGEQSLQVWDSEEEGGALPVAIELLLTLRDVSEGSKLSDSARERSYRMVFAMPQAVSAATDTDSASDSETL